jgi:hypothetical protein
VATAIGYGLAAADLGIELRWDRVANLQSLFTPGVTPPEVDLGRIPLAVFPTHALIEGVRIRPDYLRFAFLPGGTRALVPQTLAEEMFETLNRPEDVSFRYLFFDTGSGRDWQNMPIHNVAGLGIADGQRPFKKLARPMVFAPRSTIQVTVEERFGRGLLFIVFQGYKALGAVPGARR